MNAAEIVADAIATHGRPLWVAHVPKPIRHQVDAQWLDQVLETAQRSSDYLTRKDQYTIILDWCKRNVFEEVTVDSLVELSGLSAPTVRKFVGDRLDVFRKLRRGVWEVRDPKADRASGK